MKNFLACYFATVFFLIFLNEGKAKDNEELTFDRQYIDNPIEQKGIVLEPFAIVEKDELRLRPLEKMTVIYTTVYCSSTSEAHKTTDKFKPP